MSDKPLYFNGINPRGEYLTPPLAARELVARIVQVGIQAQPAWILEQTRDEGLRDPTRRSILRARRKWDLAETGWAVIFAPGLDRGVRVALDELLELRRNQATSGGQSEYFRVCEYRGESTFDFLRANGAGVGTHGDPDFLPYYLLLVGDPQGLPFQLQQELDVSYAVGRICFNEVNDYRAYARSVVKAEQRRPERPRQVGFFAPVHPGDPATRSTAEELIQPLADSASELGAPWEVQRAIGPAATKERLRSLLGGAETPALLMAACHGLGGFDDDDEGRSRQFDEQGALVCQDWPGPGDEEGVTENQYFAASDVARDATLHGLVACFVTCYSLGTPARDNFDQNSYGKPRVIAPRAFSAKLAQRLLAHPGGGALAVVGHVDRALTAGFSGSPKGEGRDPFVQFVQSLLTGETVGWAREFQRRTYAQLATQLSNRWEARRYREEVDADEFAYLWSLCNDVRNYSIFGDPAVRLPGVGDPR